MKNTILCTPGFIAKPLDDSNKISPRVETLAESEDYKGDYPKNVDFSKAARMVIVGRREKDTERTK